MYLLYCYLTALEEQEDWHHIFRILLYVHKEDNFIIVVIICSSCTAFASGNQMAVSFLLQIMWFRCVLCYRNHFFFFPLYLYTVSWCSPKLCFCYGCVDNVWNWFVSLMLNGLQNKLLWWKRVIENLIVFIWSIYIVPYSLPSAQEHFTGPYQEAEEFSPTFVFSMSNHDFFLFILIKCKITLY